MVDTATIKKTDYDIETILRIAGVDSLTSAKIRNNPTVNSHFFEEISEGFLEIERVYAKIDSLIEIKDRQECINVKSDKCFYWLHENSGLFKSVMEESFSLARVLTSIVQNKLDPEIGKGIVGGIENQFQDNILRSMENIINTQFQSPENNSMMWSIYDHIAQNNDEFYYSSPDLFNIARQNKNLTPKMLESKETISVSEALEGLGMLEAVCRNENISNIITVKKSAKVIGYFIAERIGFSRENVFFPRDKGAERKVNNISVKNEETKVLILDDVCVSGESLRRAHRRFQERLPQVHFECASLVSTFQDEEKMQKLYGYAANLIHGDSISLPWGRDKRFRVRDGKYIFGSGEKEFEVTDQQANCIQREIFG